MSEMVERVRAALLKAHNEAPAEVSFSGTFEFMARAAILAMRDPTMEMYDFSTDKMWRDRNSTEVWQSMIDGALAGGAASLPQSTAAEVHDDKALSPALVPTGGGG